MFKRDQALYDLIEFISKVEQSHFRTVHDTGANSCAMLIWNLVREYAHLPPLKMSDLPTWNETTLRYEKPSPIPQP